MPTLSHADSWRLYSWWWDSHISPKSSKWLQEDLTDMDIKVKHMIKLIEEDGDSFAMRAEMYYKRRPELINLVEEFYRAYRALAERYDHATRGLQQAHATMTKEIHNCPFVSLEPPRAFLSAEPEPHSPRILLQAHNLFDASDFLKEHSGLRSHCHTPRTNVIYSEEFDPLRRKKGLKQVNEMFALSVASNMSSFSIKSKRNGQIIQEEPTKLSDFKLDDGSEVSEGEDEKNHLENSNQFQDDDNSCNEPNQSFQFNPSVEISAQPQEGEEVLSLKHRDYMVQLKEDNEYLHEIVEQMQKEAMELKLGLQDEHLHVLQTEYALESLKLLYNQSQEKLECFYSERQKGVQMLKKREMDIHILEENLQQAKRDFDRKTEEIDELRISFEEMCMTLEKLQSQCNSDVNLLVQEIQRISRQWEDAKSRKQDLEKMVRALELMLNSLHDETSCMEKVQSELEDELRGCTLEKEVLQLENTRLHEKVNDLELKQVDAIHQMDTVTVELQSLQGMVEILRGENLFLKDVCEHREKEEALLLGKLKTMEAVSEKNHLMFSSLEDANLQLDELKRDMEVLDGSISSLRELNSNLEAENSMLRYQKDAIQGDARKILEENMILESSLRDVKLRMEEMEGNIRCLEDTCQSLSEEKFLMENERHVMMLQMDCIAETLSSWEKEYMNLHDKHMSLEIEKDSTVRRELELTILLNLEKQEKEMFFHSGNARITALEDRICHLDADVQITQIELLNKKFEAFIFEQCLFDQRDKNEILIGVQEKLEHELYEQQRAKKDLSDHVGSVKEQIFSIGREIGVDKFDQKVISERIKKLHSDSSVMEDENHKLAVEKSVQEIFLRQFAHNALDLMESTDNQMNNILGEHENQNIGEDSDSHRDIICAMLFEEEVPKLTGAYKDSEFNEGYSQFDVKMSSGFAHDKECCGKCGVQKEEVKELKAELNRYYKLLASVNDEVPCFEDCIHTLTKHQEIQEESDVKFEISYQGSPEEVADKLQNSADKLDMIERDDIKTEGRGMVSTFISKSGREAIGHTEMSNLEKEICVISTKDRKIRTDGIENSDHVDGIALKDIQLDSISSISREKETSSPCENGKSTCDTRGLDVKSVQVLKKGMNSHRNWSDALRRLSADAQRLASLQTNLLDAKRRLENIERSNYYHKDSELHSTKEQLEQVEDSVTQLIGMNRKLAKRATNGSSSPDRNDVKELEDVCNQQRRGSRKIGRWELELHKAECTLLEFEEGVERQRNRAASRGSRVALSDYLFSRAQKKKSTQQFCGCVETKDNCHVRRRHM